MSRSPALDVVAVRWLWAQLAPHHRTALLCLDPDDAEAIARTALDAVRLAWFGGVCLGALGSLFGFYLLSLL